MNKYIRRVGVIDVPRTERFIIPRRRFIGPGYSLQGRDPDIDVWLSDMEIQESREAKAAKWAFENMTALEIAHTVLGFVSDDIELLIARLHDGRNLLTLQVETLIELTQRGIHTGIEEATREKPAYFFLEPEKEFNVSLLGVFPDDEMLWHSTLSTCGLTSPKLRSGTLFSF